MSRCGGASLPTRVSSISTYQSTRRRGSKLLCFSSAGAVSAILPGRSTRSLLFRPVLAVTLSLSRLQEEGGQRPSPFGGNSAHLLADGLRQYTKRRRTEEEVQMPSTQRRRKATRVRLKELLAAWGACSGSQGGSSRGCLSWTPGHTGGRIPTPPRRATTAKTTTMIMAGWWIQRETQGDEALSLACDVRAYQIWLPCAIAFLALNFSWIM